MAFKTKKVNTKTLGEILTASRKKRGLTRAEAARLVKIQPRYLKALEEEDFVILPADVYVKGYLRDLAKLYHISGDALLDQFVSERAINNNIAQKQQEEQNKNRSKKVRPGFVLTPRTLTIFGAIILGLVSITYLFFQVRSINAAPELSLLSPAEDGTVNESLIVVRGKAEEGSSVFINNQQIVVDVNGNFLEQLSLAPGSNQLVVLARNKFGKETTLVRSIVYQEKVIAGSFTAEAEAEGNEKEEAQDASSQEATPFVSGDGEFELTVVAEGGAAWVRLQADGAEVYSGTMLPNAKLVFSAENKILITSGNGGVTKVLLNGIDQGFLGEVGEVVRDIEFTASELPPEELQQESEQTL